MENINTLAGQRTAWRKTFADLARRYRRDETRIMKWPVRDEGDYAARGMALSRCRQRYEPGMAHAAEQVVTLETAEQRDGIVWLNPVSADQRRAIIASL